MQLAPRPEIPPLSAETASECPPAEQLADPTLGGLAQADAALAILYAKCREKHRAAVAAYELVRSKLSPKSP